MRPSWTKPCGWKPRMPRSHGSRPEYDVSMWPLNISDGPPPAPSQIPRTLGLPVLDLLPLRLEAHRLELGLHTLAHRLLVAGRARDRDEVDRERDEALLVDVRRDVRQRGGHGPIFS